MYYLKWINVCLTSVQVKKEVGDVTILINNAGIVVGKLFLDIPDEMVEKSFLVNVLSHFWVNLHSFSFSFVDKYENSMYFYKPLFSHLSIPFMSFPSID